MTIAILGTGMVGKAIALDLSRDYEITCFDLNKENLDEVQHKDPSINIAANDLTDYRMYGDFLVMPAYDHITDTRCYAAICDGCNLFLPG